MALTKTWLKFKIAFYHIVIFVSTFHFLLMHTSAVFVYSILMLIRCQKRNNLSVFGVLVVVIQLVQSSRDPTEYVDFVELVWRKYDLIYAIEWIQSRTNSTKSRFNNIQSIHDRFSIGCIPNFPFKCTKTYTFIKQCTKILVTFKMCY